jgi:bacterioferritin-associated ferredoxin
VTDREIRSAVKLGLRSMAELQSTLGVATCCGRCADCARSLIDETCASVACAQGAGDD